MSCLDPCSVSPRHTRVQHRVQADQASSWSACSQPSEGPEKSGNVPGLVVVWGRPWHCINSTGPTLHSIGSKSSNDYQIRTEAAIIPIITFDFQRSCHVPYLMLLDIKLLGFSWKTQHKIIFDRKQVQWICQFWNVNPLSSPPQPWCYCWVDMRSESLGAVHLFVCTQCHHNITHTSYQSWNWTKQSRSFNFRCTLYMMQLCVTCRYWLIVSRF